MCGTIIAEIILSLSSFGEGVAVSTNLHLVILKFRKAAMLFLCVAMILTLSCPVGVCAKSDGGSDGEKASGAGDGIRIEEGVFSNETLQMAYLLYLPENYDPCESYRLVLFMHGAGDRGFDFAALRAVDYGFVTAYRDNPEYHENTILLVPQCPVPYLWVEDSWATGEYTMTDEPSPASLAAKQLLDEVVGRYSVDRSRIYAVGVSMGGMAVWDMLARYPDVFAAAAPICGCLDVSRLDEYAKTPIFTANDPRDNIVGASPTILVAEQLALRGADVLYKQYDTDVRNDDSYHSTWIDAFTLDKSEDNLYNFIFSRQRELDVETEPSAPDVDGDVGESDGASDGEETAPPDVTVYAALVLIVSSSLLLLISRRRSRR